MRPLLATAARSPSATQIRQTGPETCDCAGATISAARCWFMRLHGVWDPTLLIDGAYIARLFLRSGDSAVAGCRKYRGNGSRRTREGSPLGYWCSTSRCRRGGRRLSKYRSHASRTGDDTRLAASSIIRSRCCLLCFNGESGEVSSPTCIWRQRGFVDGLHGYGRRSFERWFNDGGKFRSIRGTGIAACA